MLRRRKAHNMPRRGVRGAEAEPDPGLSLTAGSRAIMSDSWQHSKSEMPLNPVSVATTRTEANLWAGVGAGGGGGGRGGGGLVEAGGGVVVAGGGWGVVVVGGGVVVIVAVVLHDDAAEKPPPIGVVIPAGHEVHEPAAPPGE